MTWLYNECALVSMMQGNLYDAVALLQQAMKANRRAEGLDDTRPNWLRLKFNRAVADMERGELERANSDLSQLRTKTSEEPALGGLVEGYLGLNAQLRGRRKQGARRLERAVARLRHCHGESRGQAIFLRHLADLYRGENRIDDAMKELEQAKAEAQASRLQDQLQLCHLAEAMIEIERRKEDSQAIPRALAHLDEAARYADRMEMHSLTSDVMLVRADLLRKQGETRESGSLAVTGTSIALLYGMKLRALKCMTLVGQIFVQRNYGEPAKRLLRNAQQVSEQMGYSPAVEEASITQIEEAARRPGN